MVKGGAGNPGRISHVSTHPTVFALLLLLLRTAPAVADWPTVRGDEARTGLSRSELRPPFRVVWVRHVNGERVGSAFEPVVADGKVFLATHQGSLYALDSEDGKPLWRFRAAGAFLHSPACREGLVIAANTDGGLYAVEGKTGKSRWAVFAGPGGFAASLTLGDGAVFLGSRAGEFLAVELTTGKVRWRQALSVPVRQTAAYRDGRVFVTAEDLRVRCLEAKTGKVLWTSRPLSGQTARDGYPVVVPAGRRTLVIVRTNPVVNMAQRIAQDRHLLCQTAGVDDRDWKKIDAWVKSDQSRGRPELWAQEQDSIVRHLREHPSARSFFVLDAATGEELGPAPVLWCGGCQGVGTAPVLTPSGKLLVLYRSAYGNWNHGVAPLVALGLLDPEKLRITPLEHKQGRRPPWNTFWGTADESQNFVVAGNTLLIVHQSTLSGFDLAGGKLFPIAGNRDGWGGFRNLPWARNEWNGPARGGVAVVGQRIYWQTGSRLLCLRAGEQGPAAEDQEIDGNTVPTHQALRAPRPDEKELKRRLAEAVTEVLSRRWAPLYVEPGLAGREFFFDNSADVFAALARAYPHLPADLQQRVKAYLAEEWKTHPPYGKQAAYSLTEGERREWFPVPKEVLTRPGHYRPPHSFGNCGAIHLYASHCAEGERVLAAWPQIKASFDDFAKTGWRLDPDKGDLFANRYGAALWAFKSLADMAGDEVVLHRAQRMSNELALSLRAWWKRSAERATTPVFRNITEWDAFLGKGDGLFFAVIPHRSKLAVFRDLPEEAPLLYADDPASTEKIRRTFETLCPTWHLQGEERQVHYGENYLDPPDFALDAFSAFARLRFARAEGLIERLDIPFCRGDLNYITKLALILEIKGAVKTGVP
jgi:hypothetical protein